MTKIIMTDGKQTTTIFKALNPFTDETPGVWVGGGDLSTQAQALRLVPSVFAGVSTRMQAMMDMPFTIYSTKGDKVIDDSGNYKNAVGFLPYPSNTFALMEGSLVNTGRAYFFKGTGERSGKVKELKYWIPSSVTLDNDQLKKGEIVFKRDNKTYSAEQVLYTWLLDSAVEIGPPSIWPFVSAMVAAQANGAITHWVADYMNRGAIKAMMLMVGGLPPPGEVERIEGWFNRFMTGAKGLAWKVFNGDTIKPTIIGDGLEALKDLSISKELRYEIHTALGTRHLLEDENYATASARAKQFYTQTIIPDARLIQFSFNEQILHSQGSHLEFEPERMEIFQENEAEQVKAFSDLFEVFDRVMSTEAAFNLASEKLDFEFTEEQEVIIKKGISDKQSAAPPPPTEQPPAANQVETRKLVELDKWEAKVGKAGKMVTWHAVDLDSDMVKAIKAGEMTFEQARESFYEMGAMINEARVNLTVTALREALNFKVK